MWVKGQWVKQERTLNCAYCQIPITTTNSKVRYCNDTCRSNFNGKRYHERHKGTREYYLKRLCAQSSRASLNHIDLEELYQKQLGLCALSGVELTTTKDGGFCPTNLSIDRIEPGGTYTMDNIRLVCSTVNMMRSNMSDEDLRTWCRKIASN